MGGWGQDTGGAGGRDDEDAPLKIVLGRCATDTLRPESWGRMPFVPLWGSLGCAPRGVVHRWTDLFPALCSG